MTADSDAEEWVSERLAQLARHSGPTDRSEDAGDPSGASGDTIERNAA